MAIDVAGDAEVQMLREVAHEFALRTLRPAGQEADETGETPWQAVRAAGELGLMGANVPQAYGGPGLKATTLAAVMEELGWGNFGITATIGAASLVAAALLIAGSEEQKGRYLPRLCSSESPLVGALALTEPESGSEAEIELEGQAQTLRTRAERTTGGYRLHGAKRFITNGGPADLTLLLADIDADSDGGWSLFLIERGQEGFRPGRQIPTMGLRGSYTGELFLENCELPERAVLGKPGEGMGIVLKVLAVARTMIASAAVGLARAAYETALAYSGERRQFGRPIRDHQLVAGRLATMRLEIDAARLLVAKAAEELDAGRDAALAAAEAKLFASEMAVRVTQAALQIHGGYGFTRELPLEMWVRDAIISRIFFGTSEMQLLEIAQHLDQGR
jgi:acyl-CoA dehydrogenase